MGLVLSDVLAAAFAINCALSLILHPQSDLKLIVQFMLTLSCYPASRGLAGMMQDRAFTTAIGCIIGIGAFITAISIDPDDPHGKPFIFGFDHGATQLAMLLALVTVAAAISSDSLARVAALIVLPGVVFAAAQVRFVLVATVAVLGLGAVIAPSGKRRFAILAIVMLAAILVGMLLRFNVTMRNVVYARESTFQTFVSIQKRFGLFSDVSGKKTTDGPSGCYGINIYNSIDMRKQFYSESVELLPKAGLTGIGIGRFAELSCLRGEPHNSFLQVAIEFGWPAAALFAALVMSVPLSLWPLVQTNDDALLAFLFLVFSVLLSCTAGRISEDILLFLMIGYGVSTAVECRRAGATNIVMPCK